MKPARIDGQCAPPASAGPDPPIFDTHIHYSSGDWVEYPPDRILGILEKAGVKRALVSSTPDDGTLTLYAKDPKRVVPILRPYRTRADMGHWWQDPAVLAYVQERLQKNRGVYKGIGEFHLFGGQTGTFVVKRITELALQVRAIVDSERAYEDLYLYRTEVVPQARTLLDVLQQITARQQAQLQTDLARAKESLARSRTQTVAPSGRRMRYSASAELPAVMRAANSCQRDRSSGTTTSPQA